jgi:hypothetical protein
MVAIGELGTVTESHDSHLVRLLEVCEGRWRHDKSRAM